MTEYQRSQRFVSQVSLIGVTDFIFLKIGATIAVSGNHKRAYRTHKRRLFSISTNQKRTI